MNILPEQIFLLKLPVAMKVKVNVSGFRGLAVSMLASGKQVRGFKPV
jgi:hypothetical protein